jgi:hypothetical protein
MKGGTMRLFLIPSSMNRATAALFLLGYAVAIVPTAASACETTLVTINGNVDSSSAVVNELPSNTVNLAGQSPLAQAVARFEAYDSLGEIHSINVLLFHINDFQWVARLFADPAELADPMIGGTPGQPMRVADLNVYFFLGVGSAGEGGGTLLLSWRDGAQVTRLVISIPVRQAVAPSTYNAAESPLNVTQNGGEGACTQAGHLDFDGDGIDDPAIWRPRSGMWAVLLSSSNYTQYLWKQWGLPGDYPMPGDYTGDGKTDLVVWRPSNGNWYVCRSDTNYDCTKGYAQQFGLPGDRPISGDFDGDHILDFAVWRPSLGMLFFLSSRNGQVVSRQWGLPGDIPLNTGFSR